MNEKIKKAKEEWKKILTPDEFHILREKGTEKPFTGTYLNNKKEGIYLCAGCRNKLFSSDKKFESGSGWPSFWDVISKDSVELKPDNSLGIQRTEVFVVVVAAILATSLMTDLHPPVFVIVLILQVFILR
jgi:peptide-methionine (R)-S-oxide reductase